MSRLTLCLAASACFDLSPDGQPLSCTGPVFLAGAESVRWVPGRAVPPHRAEIAVRPGLPACSRSRHACRPA